MLSKDEKQRLYRLYERYNFNKEEECSAAVVFTYCDGYFYNAEIVCFENRDEEEVQKLRKSYESGGYSVRELCYESLEKTHELLFKGFFNVDGSRRRLQNEYEKFFELQSEKLFQAEYEYIEPNYIVGKEVKTENLISTILDQLTSDGPQLVIVEAAAGFGKTCTSYEIVKNMLESENVETPIFMELSKNRRAALFRYVLLDEIDKKFNNLSSPLVLYEIENGKVPLIIDGFDELLSRSNKSTDAVKAEHDEDAQTMLDTIAELFNEHGNAKVVLTSRKSSILTGEGFKEWAEKQLKNCKVTRISIEDPTVKDWLGADKYEFLIRKEIPLESITNPILLSFLRSMPLEDFEEKCSDAENVLNYYFESLLDREKGRQSLVLTVGEQLDIMVKLASNMVQYDIHSEETAFIRSILMDIIHEQFPEYRNRYLQVEERPTEETFVYKLADHALLNNGCSITNF